MLFYLGGSFQYQRLLSDKDNVPKVRALLSTVRSNFHRMALIELDRSRFHSL